MPLVSIADLNGPPDEVAYRTEQARQLSAMYDEFITFDDGHYRAPGIHASELYPCLRKVIYSLLDVPRKPMVAKFWKQRFKMGSAIHSMVQADFHKMTAKSRALAYAAEFASTRGLFLKFEDELPCTPEHQALAAHYNIHSACDGVFTFYEDNPNNEQKTPSPVLRVGLEIKSEAPNGYESLRAPKPEHVRQGHIYMACLDLPLMWFFYMNKGNQNNTESSHPYLIPFQSEVWREVEERCQEALALAARKELPPRTETIVCEFCPWSYECKPDNAKWGQNNNTSRRDALRRPGE